MFISLIVEFTTPSNNILQPSDNSSFSYRFILFKFLFVSKYFYSEGPIEDFMKFFPKSKLSKFIAFWNMYYAPWVFIKFYETFKSFNVLFLFNGIEIIYAPFIPMSLSSSLRDSNVLFCRRMAAIHLAPSIPIEFFRIDPSIIPISRLLREEFLTRS